MKIRIGNYVFGFLAMLLFTACAKNHFEWVKINPEKIYLAKSREPQTDFVRQINIVLDLKEKGTVTYYTEPSGFFATQTENLKPENYKSQIKKNVTKSTKANKQVVNFNKALVLPKVAKGNPLAKVKTAETKIPLSAEKLNSALKIPLNSKALKSKTNAASFGQASSEIREMAFKDIKQKNPELEKQSIEKEKRGNNLMWAGLILIILGSIMGFIFGRSAFLIALAGVVFATIGYFFRI